MATARLAHLSRRLLSLSYEALLLAAVLLACGVTFTVSARTADPLVARPLLQLFLLFSAGSYFVWQWRRGGQTLAMKTWRIRVISRSGEGLTWRAAIHRFVLAIPCVLLCGLGFLWAVFDREQQFLHDRLAGTRIVWNDE